MKRWITADWHLGEDRFAIMQRPFKQAHEMIDCLIKNHNELVAPEDLVYVVGDAVYQKSPQDIKFIDHFNGAWKYQLNMFNVGVDANHFIPHNLDEVVPFAFKACTEFYDDDVWAAYNEANSQFVGKRGKKGSYFTG